MNKDTTAFFAIVKGMSKKPLIALKASKHINYPRIGVSNKICLGCGHKNKKCICGN